MLFLTLLLPLGGCGMIAGGLGASPAVVGILDAVGIATTVYDGAAVITDSKTINDRILSGITKEDCKTIRLFQGEKICVKKEIIQRSKTPKEFEKKKLKWLEKGKPIKPKEIIIFERSTGTLTTIVPPEHLP
jgi:hypothetical protein|tara:strand:+ start:80 stop:475 length:396 start_codon:yes stop_codon:yes gene_type:complete